VAPDDPTVPSWSIGASTGGSYRDDVKWPGTRLQHRFNGRRDTGAISSQPRRRCSGPVELVVNGAYTGLTGDSYVSCQRPTASAEAVSDRLHRCPLTGLTGALAEKWPTAINGSMDLVGYIYAIPRPFETCWSSGTSHPHSRTSPSHSRA
jgi:hypothetical protein